MAKAAPRVTKAVENHNTPIRSHTGRGLCKVGDGGPTHDSSSGSARRKAAAARSIAAISRSRCSWSAAARRPESSGSAAACRRPSSFAVSCVLPPPAAGPEGRKLPNRSDMAGTFAAAFLSQAARRSDIDPESTLTKPRICPIFRGKTGRGGPFETKSPPFAAMLRILRLAVLRPAGRT
jgi:hypothetical protein